MKALYQNVNSEIRKFSKEYRKIIVMSEYIRQECIDAGIDEKKVEVNYYFTPEANPVAFDPRQKKRILFFGRLSVVKGLPYILKAMKEVLDKRGDVELHIAGSGSQLEPSRQLAESLGITDNVIFHGWQGREEIRRLLETSYLVVVPSIYPEAFGIVGIEAMMCAKPVVAFDVGGISSWLKDQETGFLVPNKDSHELALRMEELLNDPALYQRMASAAREEAIKRFTPKVHFKKLLEAYQGNSI
ncbi:MAG: glycosyltransferase family 4 protein [Chitinophagaceae bacterium]|nr:glycosyltransferase family 4 protein [Chitinophagaceae bacterium]